MRVRCKYRLDFDKSKNVLYLQIGNRKIALQETERFLSALAINSYLASESTDSILKKEGLCLEEPFTVTNPALFSYVTLNDKMYSATLLQQFKP